MNKRNKERKKKERRLINKWTKEIKREKEEIKKANK